MLAYPSSSIIFSTQSSMASRVFDVSAPTRRGDAAMIPSLLQTPTIFPPQTPLYGCTAQCYMLVQALRMEGT